MGKLVAGVGVRLAWTGGAKIVFSTPLLKNVTPLYHVHHDLILLLLIFVDGWATFRHSAPAARLCGCRRDEGLGGGHEALRTETVRKNRRVYQRVRQSLNSRDMWRRHSTDPETGADYRAQHNAQTAASRPAPGSAQSDRLRMLNTAVQRKKRQGMTCTFINQLNNSWLILWVGLH